MALNSAGPGPESDRCLEKTFKQRPQKSPTAVQVTSKKPFPHYHLQLENFF